MLAKLARLILAFATFPLIGAYALRWAGGFIGQIISSTGAEARALMALDMVGAIVGVVVGLIMAVQIVGCCFQPESAPVRPVADNILIILGLTLLLDVAMVKVFAGAQWLRWLPPVNLVIWSGAAAATASLHRMRERWREQVEIPPPHDHPAGPPYGPYQPGP